MLKRLSRVLMVFAVALTVPVQGIAAVTTGLCRGLGHHGDDTHAVHDQGAGGHLHDEETAHQHGVGSSPDSGAHGSHCAPCVSCCAAAAITAFVPVFVLQQPAESAFAALPEAFSGVPPQRLDRPPLAL